MATLSGDERKRTEESISRAGWRRRMLRSRKDVDPERLKRVSKRTPVEWPRNVTLEDIIGVVGMLTANYALCFPKRGARSSIPGVDAANRYILRSSSWRKLWREGGGETTGPSSMAQRHLIDQMILARGHQLLARDVNAGKRPATVLRSANAALLRALHHPYIAADVKRLLRDELKRRDRDQARQPPSIDARSARNAETLRAKSVEREPEAEAIGRSHLGGLNWSADGAKGIGVMPAAYFRDERVEEGREEQVSIVQELLARYERLHRVCSFLDSGTPSGRLRSWEEAAKLAGVPYGTLRHDLRRARRDGQLLKRPR